MGGQAGSRGYMLQSLIAVLDSFKDFEWTSISIEPNLGSDKVDILWKYPTKKRATQVKSSQNQITKGQCDLWVQELEKSYVSDEYELTLIGPVNADVAAIKKISKTTIPIPHVLNIQALIEQASNKFDKFLEQRSITKVPVFARELLINALITKFEGYSTNGKEISREDFTKTFEAWILTVYPETMNKAAEDLKISLESRNRINEAKYKLKYEACMEALSVVDEYYKVAYKEEFIKNNVSGQLVALTSVELGERARQCHNKLVVSCDSSKVIELFRRTIKIDQKPGDSADIIVDLRSAIREELGFGDTIVDIDRDKAWIVALATENRN